MLCVFVYDVGRYGGSLVRMICRYVQVVEDRDIYVSSYITVMLVDAE